MELLGWLEARQGERDEVPERFDVSRSLDLAASRASGSDGVANTAQMGLE